MRFFNATPNVSIKLLSMKGIKKTLQLVLPLQNSTTVFLRCFIFLQTPYKTHVYLYTWGHNKTLSFELPYVTVFSQELNCFFLIIKYPMLPRFPTFSSSERKFIRLLCWENKQRMFRISWENVPSSAVCYCRTNLSFVWYFILG